MALWHPFIRIRTVAPLLFLVLLSFGTRGELSTFRVAQAGGLMALDCCPYKHITTVPSESKHLLDVASRKLAYVGWREMACRNLRLRGGVVETTGYGVKQDAETPKSFARRDMLLEMQQKAQKRWDLQRNMHCRMSHAAPSDENCDFL